MTILNSRNAEVVEVATSEPVLWQFRRLFRPSTGMRFPQVGVPATGAHLGTCTCPSDTTMQLSICTVGEYSTMSM